MQTDSTKTTHFGRIASPSVSLPKGGASMQGIGETFQPNAFSGTGGYTIPIKVTPARGFEPQLALGYNSGNGNGIFGHGFQMAFPKISRRTEKGIPRYDDSDVFLLSGQEIVPQLVANGNQSARVVRTEGVYTVTTYLPRIEAGFSCIEQWFNPSDGDCYWQITTRDNAVHLYGKTVAARVVNPAAAAQVFEWLAETSVDAKGNKIVYAYVQENYDNVTATTYESSRLEGAVACAGRYLQSIRYGNYIDAKKTEQFAFEIVFDYGERELSDASFAGATCDPYTPVRKWPCRTDAFSKFRSAFEIRTYRVCENILLFHRFKELGTAPCLVRRTALNYDTSGIFTMLTAVETTGYRKNNSGSYALEKMPPLELTFSEFAVPAAPVFQTMQMGEDSIPGLLDSVQFLPVDLHREGIEGFLYSNNDTVFYLEPLGDGQYSLPEMQEQFPVMKNIQSGEAIFTDVSGNGQLDLLVRKNTEGPGYYRYNTDGAWNDFTTLPANANDSGNAYLEMAGLSGNGKTDLLLTDENEILFYASLGDDGYAPPEKREKAIDFPSVKKNYPAELVAFSSILGDGLSHRVRITNGVVECWPSLGYGCFGSKITFANAPDFGVDFKNSRLLLADITGSGLTDLVYVHDDSVCIYLNNNGNSFSDPVKIALPETYTDSDKVTFADITGNGTSCIVFTKTGTSMRHYFFEFAGQYVSGNGMADAMKPYLLTRVCNNMGATMLFGYCSSTRFYLEDKKAGKPWSTQLPFPVQVLEQVTHIDEISGTQLTNTFAYHEGFYDTFEKEFRGFGYVETWDTETFANYTTNQPGSTDPFAKLNEKLYVPPVYTRNWYHTGACVRAGIISDQYKNDYYSGDAAAYGLPDSVFAAELNSTDPETYRQAYAALKGHVLRTEVYGQDGSDAAIHPYTVSAGNSEVRLLQATSSNPYAVFLVVPRESISLHYERNPADPRISQAFTIAVDEFGNIERTCSIVLPRRALPSVEQFPEQFACRILAAEKNYINQVTGGRNIGVVCAEKSYEITNLVNSGDYFSFESVSQQVNAALLNPVAYDATPASQAVQARELSWSRIYFWNEAQTALLPWQECTPRQLVHHAETAEFTKQMIASGFQNKLTDDIVEDAGGYFFDDASGYWWNRGMVQFYQSAPASFYVPSSTANAFADPSSSLYVKTDINYDQPYCFATVKLTRWLDNKTSNVETVLIDYITLQPKQVTDLNNNFSQVLFSPLGHVTVSSLFGTKNTKRIGGMTLYAESAKKPAEYQPKENVFNGVADVMSRPEFFLQGASSCYVYDFFAWMNGRATNSDTPVFVIAFQRENEYHVTTGKTAFSCVAAVSYSDGFGRAIETKTMADGGNWLVSGHTVSNNKGMPCQQFLPYYSSTPLYENQSQVIQTGEVPPPTVTHYDPMLRVVQTDSPKGFFSKTIFTAWNEKTFDQNDTVIDSDFYKANLDTSGTDLKDALDKAALHYNTPATSILDSMGHTFLRVVDNLGGITQDAFAGLLAGTTLQSADVWNELVAKGFLSADGHNGCAWLTVNFKPYTKGFALALDPVYAGVESKVLDFLRQGCLTSYYAFDVLGRQLWFADPRLYYANVVNGTQLFNFSSVLSMGTGQVFSATSADAGTGFHFHTIFGGLVWSLTARNFNQTITYDRLQRKTQVRVVGLKDDGTVATDNVVEVFAYGESQPAADSKNLRGMLYQLNDQSGTIVYTKYDLHGVLLESKRQFTQENKMAINWGAAVPLDSDTYLTTCTYDALGRKTSEATPDGNTTLYTYNQEGLLETISVKNSKKAIQQIISGITYNAAHRRLKVTYGNGSQTAYTYEDTTLNLVQLKTTRTQKNAQGNNAIDVLQDLNYTYDPSGNITRLYDNSIATVFSNNQLVAPLSDFTYDALYRLVKATGRQHPGLTGTSYLNNSKNNDFKQSRYMASPNDVAKLENYMQLYLYDEGGNLIKTSHKASNAWTREMPVLADSNRLQTIIEQGQPVGDIGYDRSGNQKKLNLNSSVSLTWSCCENLSSATLIQRPGEMDDADNYTYDSNELRTRRISTRMSNKGAVAEIEEKRYLGHYEEKIIKTVSATTKKETLVLRRDTLHVMDGNNCVATIHSWVQDTKKREVDKRGMVKIRFQLNNHLGSSSMELDGTAQLISYEEYFPYGGTAFIAGVNQKEVALKEYRYSGKERDDSTGLYYYGARYYAPWLFRWLSADPAGAVDGPNLFAFVKGNPVILHDATGLAAAAPMSDDEDEEEEEEAPRRVTRSSISRKRKGARDDDSDDENHDSDEEDNTSKKKQKPAPDKYHWGTTNVANIQTGDEGLDQLLRSFGEPQSGTKMVYMELADRIGFESKKGGSLTAATIKDLHAVFEASRPLMFMYNKLLNAKWTQSLNEYSGTKEEIALYGHMRSKMTEHFKSLNIGTSGASLNEWFKEISGRPAEIHHILFKKIFPQLANQLPNLMMTHRSERESVYGPGQHELMHMLASGNNPDKFKVIAPNFSQEYKNWYGKSMFVSSKH